MAAGGEEKALPQQKRNSETKGEPAARGKSAKQPKYDWDDPKIPAGDAPPMPRWPLVLSAVSWCGWLVFHGMKQTFAPDEFIFV